MGRRASSNVPHTPPCMVDEFPPEHELIGRDITCTGETKHEKETGTGPQVS
jgi:hypothetical protein